MIRSRSLRNLFFVFLITVVLIGTFLSFNLRVSQNEHAISSLQTQIMSQLSQIAQQNQWLKNDHHSRHFGKRLETGNAQTKWIQLLYQFAGNTNVQIQSVTFTSAENGLNTKMNTSLRGSPPQSVSNLTIQLSLYGQRAKLLQFIQDVQTVPWITGITSVNLSLSVAGPSQMNVTCVVPYET
ncbi:hypothetical protein ATW55_07900 [Ferroacidibacillus organovorans]|uniref:Uncharacterized protein n=1 Tax=Ferroacidibacillus organovorans TaxID=1765683 RepID=A0A101XSJ1_9BACL|nr:hypothetical protein ATW55_07900 [Ferroacidibacillus organovorans]